MNDPFSVPQSSLAMLSDGQYRYDIRPSNRWTTGGSPSEQDWVEVNFGVERPVDTVKLYVLDDRGLSDDSPVRAPAKIELAYWAGSGWKPVPGAKASAEITPEGRRPHVIRFPLLKTERLRAVLPTLTTPAPG